MTPSIGLEKAISNHHNIYGILNDPFFLDNPTYRTIAEVLLVADFIDAVHDMSRKYHKAGHMPLIDNTLKWLKEKYGENLSKDIYTVLHELNITKNEA